MSKPNANTIGIKRDDYKAIKRMDRIELSEYLQRIWKRGFEAGLKSKVATMPVIEKAQKQNDSNLS